MKSNLSFDDFNPDCMTEDDICLWIDFMQDSPVDACAMLSEELKNPNALFHHIDIYRKGLIAYLCHKKTAMRLRSSGQIALALTHEKDCDAIYAKLPESLKW